MRRTTCVVLIALLLPAGRLCAQAPQTNAEGLATRLDTLLDQKREELHIPGLSFAVVKDDEVIYLKAFGHRDIERGLAATPDTVFPIGSCTKAFTSMAAALARDLGLLSFDDRPGRFLSYFHMADPDANARVTIRDMLGHRTGLRAYADLAAEPAVLSREEYVRAAVAAQPAYPFRSRFQYSNAMYAAAGEVLGRAYHSSWENVIASRIFGPLAMNSSVANVRDLSRAPDHTTGYRYDAAGNSWRTVPPPRSLDALAPAGALGSSARDMSRWLRMLTAGGVLDGKRFVSEVGLREVTSPQIAINNRLGYAMGWANYEWNRLRVVEHNGGSDGISALVSFIPERRVGFVLLANVGPNGMTRLASAAWLIYPLILGQPSQGEPPASQPAPAPSDTPKISTQGTTPAADSLVSRMIDAAGGNAALRRHVSLSIRATKSYDNQGVMASLAIRARAPALRDEEEQWTAAGRAIGRARVYFDGAHGGEETSFGQDGINGDEENARARRDDDFRLLLDLQTLYPAMTVAGRADIDGEPAYALQLAPSETLYVSARTGLVLRRDKDAESTRYGDYRKIDGEMVAFSLIVQDSLGRATIRVKEARFNVRIPDEAFAARAGR